VKAERGSSIAETAGSSCPYVMPAEGEGGVDVFNEEVHHSAVTPAASRLVTVGGNEGRGLYWVQARSLKNGEGANAM
jgi:hypothetical protein